jgi:transcriptional regulator with XRE-family HTH domain
LAVRWRRAAGEAIKASRHASGLTQAGLARAAGVPQSSISELESGRRQPSLPLLAHILESAQGPMELRIVPVARHDAAHTAERVAGALSPEGPGEDGALRAVIDLRDALARADVDVLDASAREAPQLVGDRRFDAFIAGVVEEAYGERRLEPPGWTQERARFARPFWHLSGIADLHWWEFSTAPGALLRHGVVAAEAELQSV